jgi:glycosyltransferase involved in cell wall biosynthesis
MQITHDLQVGGLQQVVVNLCRNIDRHRFHVTVLCLRSLGPLAKEIERLGIKVILLPQKTRGTDYFSFLKVAKILRQEGTQVIHSHNTQPLVDGTLGAILSGGWQRIIHTDHARQFPDKLRYMLAEWCCSHFVYRMFGVSEQTTVNLRKFERISVKKLKTIENGIDRGLFEVCIDVKAKRTELGLSHSGPVIGVVTRLEKVKGLSYLLHAMPRILTMYPSVTLLVVGEGAERRALENESAELGIQSNVVFIGCRFDIPEILQVLDVYLLPSLSEGLPMGVLEAMAAGCPVIATDVGGVPSVVADRESGLLVAPRNTRKIADAVIQLLADEQLRKQFSQRGFQKFESKFSAAFMTKRYENHYLGA